MELKITIAFCLILCVRSITQEAPPSTDLSNEEVEEGQTKLGVFLKAKKKIFTSHASWYLVAQYNLTELTQFLEKLSDQVQNVMGTLDQFDTNNHALKNSVMELDEDRRELEYLYSYQENAVKKVQAQWTQELSYIVKSTQELQNMLQSREFPRTPLVRHKRALFDFVGEGLSQLIGLSTRKQTSQVKQAVIQVQHRQIVLQHHMAQSLSILNETSTEVRENREIITQLTDRSVRIIQAINALSAAMETRRAYAKLEEFQTLHSEMARIIASAFRQAHARITNLKMLLTDTFAHQVSLQFTDPHTFAQQLLSIQEVCDRKHSLPYPPRTEIAKYYETLKATLIKGQNGLFYVATRIPLVTPAEYYHLFQIYITPVLHEESNTW